MTKDSYISKGGLLTVERGDSIMHVPFCLDSLE